MRSVSAHPLAVVYISIMSQQGDVAAASSSSPVPSADPPQEPPAPQPTSKGKPKKEYRQIQMPTPEQIVQEDMMNNCGIRTVMSGVMGMGLGLVFGIVMGSMDAGVSISFDALPHRLPMLRQSTQNCVELTVHHACLVL